MDGRSHLGDGVIDAWPEVIYKDDGIIDGWSDHCSNYLGRCRVGRYIANEVSLDHKKSA